MKRELDAVVTEFYIEPDGKAKCLKSGAHTLVDIWRMPNLEKESFGR